MMLMPEMLFPHSQVKPLLYVLARESWGFCSQTTQPHKGEEHVFQHFTIPGVFKGVKLQKYKLI